MALGPEPPLLPRLQFLEGDRHSNRRRPMNRVAAVSTCGEGSLHVTRQKTLQEQVLVMHDKDPGASVLSLQTR